MSLKYKNNFELLKKEKLQRGKEKGYTMNCSFKEFAQHFISEIDELKNILEGFDLDCCSFSDMKYVPGFFSEVADVSNMIDLLIKKLDEGE